MKRTAIETPGVLVTLKARTASMARTEPRTKGAPEILGKPGKKWPPSCTHDTSHTHGTRVKSNNHGKKMTCDTRYTQDNSGTKETRESHGSSDTWDTSGSCQRVTPKIAAAPRKREAREKPIALMTPMVTSAPMARVDRKSGSQE
ncbi:hypothetical protein MJT46_018530 [Ovis ammon polii x Ovis aries]|nr:hypothetical protein MJT46_018530 [Ovis ammon polii x Ovis aries]